MSKRRRRLTTIMIPDTRGIHDQQACAATHIRALAPLLVDRGWDINVVARSPYLPLGKRVWNGVTIEPIWAPRHRQLEALVHTGLGVALASVRRPDVVHIHAIGPALLTPVARAT